MVDFAKPENLTPEVFCAQGAEQAMLNDFGDQTYLEGLTLLSAGLRQDIMSKGGRRILGKTVVDYLVNRLRVVDYHAQHPTLRDQPVEAPIVIVGLPRTGTTVLSYLLDQDPQWRSLLNWEAVTSVPPPTTGTLRTDPRCTELLAFQKSVLPIIDPPPPHWEWADGPTECTFLLAQDFKAAMWESRVPNPDYRDFISTVDMTSAYEYHRSALQVLQSEAPGTWCLKMPAHAFFIDALLKVYPDARIIWTHRDPATCTASFMNLLAFSHGISMGYADTEWIASTTPERLRQQVTRPMQALAGRNVHHVHYRDFMAEPMAAMSGVYEWLGTELSADVEASMTGWLAADPLKQSRKATYALADFGIERADLHKSFGEYIETFGVTLDS